MSGKLAEKHMETNKVTSLSLCIQARRQAEAQQEAEWQEMINAMDQQALLGERELMRKQR